jgi:clorobiocin biosynthesis protein CloN6
LALLGYPHLDVAALLRAVDARLIGIDLHWMVHVQGSLAVAGLIKECRPDVPVLFGGISSTYYATELIRYPQVDMVLRGYDTHAPMVELLHALGNPRGLARVDNLIWKQGDMIVDNGYAHKPDRFSCGIDWSRRPGSRRPGGLPILEVMSTQNAGCAYNCSWCGGSRDAFRRINGRRRAMARKDQGAIDHELATLKLLPGVERHHFYSVGSYNEPPARFEHFLDRVAETKLKSISYEQFHLTPDDLLRRMAAATARTVITLSPESHDMRVAKLSGRGVYTPAEMEAWIERALDIGIHEIDIWYFIGMPEQDARSVEGTLEYCGRLLRRFRGRRVVPFVCPMIPFLDPASTLFEEPERHGYRVFYRTVEEHRAGMERASLMHRINYETRWLSRRDLVTVGYGAVRRLAELKAEVGMYPSSVAEAICARIDDTLEFIDIVHGIDCLADPTDRRRELERHSDEILRRNNDIFFAGVANQAFPIPRDIGGRWFDEFLWDPAALDAENTARRSRAPCR